MIRTRIIATSIIPALLVAVVSACAPPSAGPSGGAGTPGVTQPGDSPAARHNDADTTFAQMMVIHHEGAIEMAALAETEASSDDVRSLAGRIKAAQGPEIDQMRGWLTEWGEPAPEDSDMAGMDHGGMDMGGLDQQAAMDELRGLDGVEFDRRFLELMIAHHQGAITMANEEVAQGENDAAVALAKAIIAAQEKEIAGMQAMLEGLG